jgi:hypothetical protein
MTPSATIGCKVSQDPRFPAREPLHGLRYSTDTVFEKKKKSQVPTASRFYCEDSWNRQLTYILESHIRFVAHSWIWNRSCIHIHRNRKTQSRLRSHLPYRIMKNTIISNDGWNWMEFISQTNSKTGCILLKIMSRLIEFVKQIVIIMLKHVESFSLRLAFLWCCCERQREYSRNAKRTAAGGVTDMAFVWVYVVRQTERDPDKVTNALGPAAALHVFYAGLTYTVQRKPERLGLRGNQTRPGLPGSYSRSREDVHPILDVGRPTSDISRIRSSDWIWIRLFSEDNKWVIQKLNFKVPNFRIFRKKGEPEKLGLGLDNPRQTAKTAIVTSIVYGDGNGECRDDGNSCGRDLLPSSGTRLYMRIWKKMLISEASFVPFSKSWLLDHITDKDWTVKQGNAFKDIMCVVWAAVLHLLLSRRLPKLPAIQLITVRVIFSLLFCFQPVFHCWKQKTFQNWYIARGQQ